MCTCYRHQPHEILIREGYPADHVLILCTGRVKLVAASSEGRLFLLRVAVPGDFLGLAALLHNTTHSVTGEALELCTIQSMPRAAFLRLMASHPDVGHGIAHSLASEYNQALLTARRLALHTTAAGKLASTLLEMARVDDLGNEVEVSRGPVSFPMQLTHEDLGNMAGLSRETVSRLLTRFRRDGLICQTEEHMTVNRPDRFEAVC